MKLKFICSVVGFAFFTISAISCSGKKTLPIFKQNQNDSVWIAFLNALLTKDVKYLVKHSSDIIQCADCNLDDKNQTEFYKASFIFHNHIDKLMHISNLKQLKYKIAEDESQMQVVYSITSKQGEEGAYSLIFLFRKTSNGLVFGGMLVT